MSTIERLDLILDYLAKKRKSCESFTMLFDLHKMNSNEINDFGRDTEFGCLYSELHIYLDELIRNEYVYFQNNLYGTIEYDCALYSITVKGIIFHGTGGYKAQLKRESKTDNIKTLERGILAGGTLLAGIFALFEMLKWLFAKHHSILSIDVLTISVVLLCGIGAGIIVTLLILEVLSRKKRLSD